MKRKIINIDEAKCDGCGLCVKACHEGAIQMRDGKAKLVSDTYCDGLGDCLGECPQGAITIIEREAADFDEQAVEAHLAKQQAAAGQATIMPSGGGCPGSAPRMLQPQRHHGGGCPGSAPRVMSPADQAALGPMDTVGAQPPPSQLQQWPVQLRLVRPELPAFDNADLVVCADCVPFTVADFHQRYLKDKAVVVGCPKLDDDQEMLERLSMIIARAPIRSLTVLRMEVPCCGGIAQAAVMAARQFRPDLPLEVHVIGINGHITVNKLEAVA